MKNWHTEKFVINDTNLNNKNIVPITEIIRFLQIATFNHSKLISLDHKTMQEQSNAFWVVTKMKLKLSSSICQGDKISATTWTHPVGGVRALRDCHIKCGNSIKVKATSEWCCLDWDTRKLRKMNSISYPNLLMEKTNNLNLMFSNLREDVSQEDFVYTRKVRSTDIDVNNHTNNLKYNFMAFDCLAVEELNKINIKEYEIHFVNESCEGDEISMFKKHIRNAYYIEGKIQDKTIFKVVIKFQKIN